MRLRARVVLGLAVGALAALAAWPFVMRSAVALPDAATARVTPAPVTPDYLYRNGMIADLEADVRRHPDQLDARMLAGQYLQRFREVPDVGDLLRAVANARLAMRYQPRYNVAAEATLASAYTALHKFRLAKQYADDVVLLTPWDPGARATAASLAMELGDYSQARRLLQGGAATRATTAWETVAARYAELTGRLDAARDLIRRAAADADSNSYLPAENRAWFHWRSGELAFEAGDLVAAKREYREALVLYPGYWHATNGLAKVYWASRRWREAEAAARASADVYPLPETLGYEYDAQLALGDRAGARVTRDLIGAIEHIGNTQGINDRLIAIFYSDHHLQPAHAVAIARRDMTARDDVYAEDTLAWALAMAGRWREALPHAERATAMGSVDARLLFHTGVIELQNGRRAAGIAHLRAALSINPFFNPYQAPLARNLLRQVSASR